MDLVDQVRAIFQAGWAFARIDKTLIIQNVPDLSMR